MKALLKLTKSEAKKVVGGLIILIPDNMPYTDILISKFGLFGGRGPDIRIPVTKPVDHPTVCTQFFFCVF